MSLITTKINAQEYIDALKEAKFNAKCELDNKTANLAQVTLAYQNAKSWKSIVSEYWKRIDATNQLAKEILESCLKNAMSHSTIIGKNAHHSKNAIALLGNATKIVSDCIDEMKISIQALLFEIKCLESSEISPSNGVYKCLTDLDKALSEAQTAACLAFEKALVVLEGSWKLNTCINGEIDNSNVNANPDSLNSGEKKGLRSSFKDMKNLISTGTNETCEMKTVKDGNLPNFPMGEGYFNDIKSTDEAAIEACNKAKSAMTDAESSKDKAQAKYDAICSALDAALAARKC